MNTNLNAKVNFSYYLTLNRKQQGQDQKWNIHDGLEIPRLLKTFALTFYVWVPTWMLMPMICIVGTGQSHSELINKRATQKVHSYSDWEGKGPCAIVPFTWKMAHYSVCRMLRNGPLKISKNIKKSWKWPIGKNLFPIPVATGTHTFAGRLDGILPGLPIVNVMDLVQATPLVPHGTFSVVIWNWFGLEGEDFASTYVQLPWKSKFLPSNVR